MDAKGAKALKSRIDREQAKGHACKISTVKDGKNVCVYCGQEMEL
jgi:hypothetical protein